MTATTVCYSHYGVTVHAGDCLDVLRELPKASVHAVVTDPPYGLEFMGKDWDKFGGGKRATPGVGERATEWVSNRGWNEMRCRSCGHLSHGGSPCRCDAPDFARADDRWPLFQEWCTAWAAECLRVLKPGGHLLAFGGSRTWHRLTAAVEDAGFEIRDSIAWLYASGFPKSLDVSKAIDKAAGAEREVTGPPPYTRGRAGQSYSGTRRVSYDYEPQSLTAPATDDAHTWQGWGTALKPGFEPIVVARKPLAGTVAGNVLEHGAGALNIDGCRIGTGEDRTSGGATGKRVDAAEGYMGSWADAADGRARPTGGRWPSNVVITHAATPDGADLCAEGCVPGCPVRELDEQAGVRSNGSRQAGTHGLMGYHGADALPMPAVDGDPGGASRFFPVFRFEAKAPPAERPRVDGVAHPTVKPLALMRWLVRLVTPSGGVVLDPFLGSGTTAHAARAEGFACVGIERDVTYLPLIRARLDGDGGPDLFGAVL